MKIHEKYLSRCLQIARNGLGTAAPNPSVGAVIIHENRIIGEGYTSPFGGPHAEVRAIAAVSEQQLLKASTLYVTLEPCSHHGKTPPCADLILKKGIPRVVIGTRDPHARVAGKGIARLREGGCEVQVGILGQECREHHRRFITYCEKHRPYVVLKWAQSGDGFMAPLPEHRETPPQPYWITSPLSRQLVHKWRSEEQAILIGTRTALEDNPRLTTRMWEGTSPLRVLIDRELKVPGQSHIFDEGADTLVFCQAKPPAAGKSHIRFRKLSGAHQLVKEVLEGLWEEQVLSVLVEGGAQTLEGFLRAGMWDEARILEGPVTFGRGLPAPRISGQKVKEQRVGRDLIRIYRNVAQSDF